MQRFDYWVLPEQDGMRLEWYLRKHHGYSRRIIIRLKQIHRALCRNGEHARAVDLVRAGDHITVTFPQDGNDAADCPVTVPVAYEDDRVIVYQKPAGMATHQTLRHPLGTLSNVFVSDMRRQGLDLTFRVLNRLDRDTSGLVVAAKDMHAAARLTETRVSKRYLAVCEGTLPARCGTIDLPIARVGETTTLRCVRGDGQPAVTHYRVLAAGGDRSFLLLRLETGRTHQIRVHLSAQGNPLMGDDMYGGGLEEIGRQALHCAAVAFSHPTDGRAIVLEAPLLEDMRQILPKTVQNGELDAIMKEILQEIRES